MSVEGNNINYYPGAMQTSMQTSTERRYSENIPDCNNQQQQQKQKSTNLSSYLLLSPSNPLRTFAISFLTHWIYSTVIIVTISAFVLSSVYCNLWCDKKVDNGTGSTATRGEDTASSSSECAILHWTRRILFIVILLEIIIKALARGLLVDAFSYLRITWDWLDIISLVSLFVSIIIPWKAVESLAAGIVLLKFIPIHPGSISAFVSLCSCAKKLIPVLVYGIIIVWIYGVVIFTLFAKYQQQDIIDEGDPRRKSSDASTSKTNNNVSDSDSDGGVENENTTQESRVAAFVDGDYLTPSTSKTSQNFSYGLSVECLPTNLRSLSGSLIQAGQMLTLGFSQSDHASTTPSAGGNVSNLNTFESQCQYEIYTLSIVETLVIISGTLPMITMTFGALYDFFQKESYELKKLALDHEDNVDAEHDSSHTTYYHQYHHRRSTVGSAISGTNSQTNRDERSSCLSSSFKQLANIFCDCDYYFCCLANLQRRLDPYAARIFNSRRFMVFVLFVVSVDCLCMIVLLWFSTSTTGGVIDFSYTWLITYCLQICFGIYTLEAVFRWLAVSSDEYWMTIWSAFDLTLVIVYWIGYVVMYKWNYDSYYPQFCGILMIRLLKIIPYWKPLEHSLNLMMFSLLGKLHNLFVILICSCSTFLLKYAVNMIEIEIPLSSHDSSNVISSNTPYFYIIVEPLWHLILYFLFSIIILFILTQTLEILETRQREQSVHPQISFLFQESPSEELVNMQYQNQRSTRNLNVSSSPISIMSLPNGTSPMKYRFASTPSGSHNGLLINERQSFLSPSSDVLSPLLSIPSNSNSNGLNGHVQNVHTPIDDINCTVTESNVPLNNNRRGTRQSIQSFFCSSKEQVFDYISSGIIILSSVDVLLDSADLPHVMGWNTLRPGQSLWLEILFILCIGAHIIYKTRLSRFSRETFIQITCICDLLIILAASVDVFGSGMKWFSLQSAHTSVKVFVNSAKVISSCRGVLLLSRLSCLQRAGNCLSKLFWKVANYLASFGYIWLIFIIASNEAQKMITSINDRENMSPTLETLEVNHSVRTGSSHIEHYKGNITPHSSLVVLTILLFLLSFGVFLGLLIHNIGSWNEVINKYSCAEGRSSSFQVCRPTTTGQPGIYFPVPQTLANKPTEGVCVPVLHFVANHPTFDIIVVALILMDGIIITFEHLATSERALILRKHYPAYILFLYLLELSAKLAGNGLNFFKSNWNMLDFVIIAISITDYLISLIMYNHYVPVLILNVRFLRVLRIFQFYPLVHRAQIIHTFFSIVSKVNPALCTFGAFYFSLYLVTIVFRLRCIHFIQLAHSAAIWIAAPFQVLNAQTVFEVLGNLKVSNFTFESILFFCCLLFFSVIRISVIFCTCLVLVATLCQYIMLQQQKAQMDTTEISRFTHSREGADESVDFDDKYSYQPCASPETIGVETPSSSGTQSRIHNTAIPKCVGVDEQETPQNNPNSTLYKTTTITSSEEINGCKVFYVEAMITTV